MTPKLIFIHLFQSRRRWNYYGLGNAFITNTCWCRTWLSDAVQKENICYHGVCVLLFAGNIHSSQYWKVNQSTPKYIGHNIFMGTKLLLKTFFFNKGNFISVNTDRTENTITEIIFNKTGNEMKFGTIFKTSELMHSKNKAQLNHLRQRPWLPSLSSEEVLGRCTNDWLLSAFCLVNLFEGNLIVVHWMHLKHTRFNQ